MHDCENLVIRVFSSQQSAPNRTLSHENGMIRDINTNTNTNTVIANTIPAVSLLSQNKGVWLALYYPILPL